MANDYSRRTIYLDTFTAAIDLKTSLGHPTDSQIFINSIEWKTPTNVNHTAVITETAGNTDYIFSETCTVANQSTIKYFHGRGFKNVCIAISGVGSGAIIIELA